MNDEQQIWYGFCTYWTDDWEALSATPVEDTATGGHGIPCCPECGSVGYQMTLQEWNEGIEKFEADDNPGYGDFINEMKAKCHGPKTTLAELWELKKQEEAQG